MREYKLKIDTPEGTVFSGGVISVIFESEDGSVGILNKREQGIIALVPGRIRITFPEGGTRQGATSSGVVVVEKERVHILTDDMLWEEEIDVDRQRQNLKILRERLFHEKQMLHREYVLAAAAFARASARLKVKGT